MRIDWYYVDVAENFGAKFAAAIAAPKVGSRAAAAVVCDPVTFPSLGTTDSVFTDRCPQ